MTARASKPYAAKIVNSCAHLSKSIHPLAYQEHTKFIAKGSNYEGMPKEPFFVCKICDDDPKLFANLLIHIESDLH